MATDDIEHMFYKDMDSQNYKIIAVGNSACYNFCYLFRHIELVCRRSINLFWLYYEITPTNAEYMAKRIIIQMSPDRYYLYSE